MEKTIDTLVSDIYKLMSTKEIPEGVDLEKEIDNFGESVKKLMRSQFNNTNTDRRTLRMSNIGKSNLFLWNLVNGVDVDEVMPPHTLVKFLYGHLIEEMVLFLTKVSGHKVTDEQKRCEVEGIVGHMDCKIDGTLVDVKSTSSYGFKKFKDETLAESDNFGYIDQLKGYAHAEDTREIAWLAMDKQNGHLCVLKYDLDDEGHPMYKYYKGDIVERIKEIKKITGEATPPSRCFEPVPDGKSGNLKLDVGCSYCIYKEHCYPELRTFAYSTGLKHLVKVVNEPKVYEVTKGGVPDGL